MASELNATICSVPRRIVVKRWENKSGLLVIGCDDGVGGGAIRAERMVFNEAIISEAFRGSYTNK